MKNSETLKVTFVLIYIFKDAPENDDKCGTDFQHVKTTFRTARGGVYMCEFVCQMCSLVLVMPTNILGINLTRRIKGSIEVFHPTGWSVFCSVEAPSSAEFITVSLQWWRTSAFAPQVNAVAHARRSCMSRAPHALSSGDSECACMSRVRT